MMRQRCSTDPEEGTEGMEEDGNKGTSLPNKPKDATSGRFGGSVQVWLGLAACGMIVLLGGKALNPSNQAASGLLPGQAAVGEASSSVEQQRVGGDTMRSLSDNDWQNDKEGDRCASQWRLDALVGRCFGLKLMPVDELKGPRWQDCRDYCCGLGHDCVTWQYREEDGCKVGGPIRLGLERADTPNWCEPSAPAAWKGRRRQAGSGGVDEGCKWGGEEPYQCFGLGPERTKQDEGNRRLSEEECEALCCGDSACEVWQWRQDKGCFVGVPGNCDSDNRPFKGARKCVPGFCGEGRAP